MNLFQNYGIKEVADVVIYGINQVGDEEYYTPLLYLDTLKVSTLEKTSELTVEKGGYGNGKVIAWSSSKDITLNLEDALFTPASMSLMWGGQLNMKFSKYTSTITKLNIANKYGRLNYSIRAYPSPTLDEEEWKIIFEACDRIKATFIKKKIEEEEIIIPFIRTLLEQNLEGEEYIEENKTLLKNSYYQRNFKKVFQNNNKLINGEVITNNASPAQYGWCNAEELILENLAIPEKIIEEIISMLTSLSHAGEINTAIHDIEVIDRMEKCYVKNKDGLSISTIEQKKNLLKYYKNDVSSSYTIYYDYRTMLPLLNVDDNGYIKGWDINGQIFTPGTGLAFSQREGDFKLRPGTCYLKWTRTIKQKEDDGQDSLGKTIVINTDTFPKNLRLVGETYIRNQKTGKDQRYQFIIYQAQISGETNLTLQADGDPTTFSMKMNVLVPKNEILMELKQYDVEEDLIYGGTRIVPQKAEYTHTAVEDASLKSTYTYENPEIY